MRIVITLLLAAALVSGCSDDNTTAKEAGVDLRAGDLPRDSADAGDSSVDAPPDAPSDASAGTMLPGCSAPCAAGEVCQGGTCVAAGPTKQCGTNKFGDGLPASAVIFVDAAYSGGNSDGTQSKPFSTISAAIAAIGSSAKPTIAVADGDYAEDVTIDRSLSLRCRCASKVSIVGHVNVTAASGADIEVTIDGCTVRPAGSAATPAGWTTCGSGDSPHAVSVTGLGAVSLLLRDSELTQACVGLYVNLPDSSTSAICVARSRLWANVRGLDAQLAPASATLQPFSECAGPAGTEALSLVRSRIDQNETYGVYTRQGVQGLRMQSTLVALSGHLGATSSSTANAGIGVYLGDTKSAHLSSNRIEHNKDRGIALYNNSGLQAAAIAISDNALDDNHGAGIAIQQLQASTTVSIENNSISATATVAGSAQPDADAIQVAIKSGATFNVSVSGNTISASARNGVLLDGVGGSVSGNTVSDSTAYGVMVQGGGAASIGSNTYSNNALANTKTSATTVHPIANLPVPVP